MYVQATQIFQSTAQILVVKRNSLLTQVQVGMQFAFVEDYVGTQVTLLKSEKVLRAAAAGIDKGQLHFPFPDDESGRIQALGQDLTVTRDKEGMTGSMGSNVLNLAYKCPNSQDAALILNAIIKAYRQELMNIYESTTRIEIENLSTYLADRNSDYDKLQQKYAEKNRLMRDASLEEFVAIQQRYADLGRQLAATRRDQKEDKYNL